MLTNFKFNIPELDIEAMEKCQIRLDNLTKPLNSLYYFELIAKKIAGLTSNPKPAKINKMIVVLSENSEISIATKVFSEHVNAQTMLLNLDNIITNMSFNSSDDYIKTGLELATNNKLKTFDVIGLGQISSKIVASTNEFIKLYYNNNTISLDNIRNKEILIISGFIIGLAQAGKAVVIDGIASTAAALIATSIEPKVKEYLLASHYDKNDIHKKILEEINIPSYLFLEMNCDDGTGAAMGMSLIDASLHVLNDMKTFGEAEVAIAQDGPGALKQSKVIK